MSSSASRTHRLRKALLPRRKSPTLQTLPSDFNESNILPQNPQQGSQQVRQPSPGKAEDTTRQGQPETQQVPVTPEALDFGEASGDGPMSAGRSSGPPSVFDQAEQLEQHYTPPTTVNNPGSGSDEPSYDLKPPPPSVSHDNVEALSERFFSVDHLDTILRDHNLAARFNRFLSQYRPQHAPTLTRYLDTKKAIAAIEYANALAESIPTSQGHPPFVAATLDDRFEAKSAETVEDLVEEALPAYITHRFVTLVTDTLVKEITGNSAPVMREMIPSLAEVYCVTDPSLPDNPIVYASEGLSIVVRMQMCS
jgi:hypothetical protein